MMIRVWLCAFVLLTLATACVPAGSTPPPAAPAQQHAASEAPPDGDNRDGAEAGPDPAPVEPAANAEPTDADVLGFAQTMADAMHRNAGNCDQMGADLMDLVNANPAIVARMRAMRGTQEYRDFKAKFPKELDDVKDKAKAMQACMSNAAVKDAIKGM